MERFMSTWQQYLLVAVGSAAGGCLRFGVGSFVANRCGTSFPWGTFVVNVTGSFALGVFLTFALERLALDPRWKLLAAVGFLGGYTTFSTFAWETAKLLESRQLVLALGNVLGSVTAAGLGILGGASLARWWS
jgi:fluoride exporter